MANTPKRKLIQERNSLEKLLGKKKALLVSLNKTVDNFRITDKKPNMQERKIKELSKKIRTLEVKVSNNQILINKIVSLANAIALHIRFNVRNSSSRIAGKSDDKSVLARAIFYKYGSEKLRIQSLHLREYVGSDITDEPRICIEDFTNEFKADWNAKYRWELFCEKYEAIVPAIDDFIDNRRSPGA